ncbi:hypothetical protein [Pedobacter ureilyticus]|uniref:Uncharacterized protein n=1 Tax=Pedobacter ureilyticus TaxID=1393051 RepID=A0ABW9J243_9SPHI|nr:hypothetical protein [Pedobacter helvus]
MTAKTSKITFTPRELVRKPSTIIILVLLILFFSNVFTMWTEAFAGNTPYGSSEDFQTLDGGFKYTLVLSKFTTADEEIAILNEAFDKFKKEYPKHINNTLYRTSDYYNINAWMFWKWYRFFETGHIRAYPHLDTAPVK